MAFAQGRGTIVAGSTLASRQLRHDFDAARRAEGSVVWDSPDILPRDAWMRRTWLEYAWQECASNAPATAPVLLTRWQELTLWEEAIEATTRDVLLNSHTTATAAREAWQLMHAWRTRPEGSNPDESAFDQSDDTRAFFSWMGRVRRQMIDRGWITMAELPSALREGLTARGSADMQGQITWAGFDEIAPADRLLFEALGARESADPLHAGRECTRQAARVVGHDVGDELTQAAAWARQKLQAHSGAPPLRVGIVVPGLGSMATIVERIFDDILHPTWGFARDERAFAISEGESLGEAPMVAIALQTLRLIEKVPREEAAAIWRSPYLGIGAGEAARLDIELRRQKVEYAGIHVESVKRRFPEMAARAAALHARLRPSQWSSAFSDLLRMAGWPGQRTLTPAENRTLESWKNLLSELARLDVVLDFISCGSAISRLERMAGATRLAFEDENAAIQILDITEAAGARFDALWIAGLHAGAWPQRAKPSPFLPLALQRGAGMPHSSAEREAAYAKRVTERLFASANEVVCSYPAHAADEELRPSPFLATLPVLSELPRPHTAMRRVFLRAPALESMPSEEPVALPAGTPQRGGTQVLADQSACPFRAFAVHRLRAREMDEVDVGWSAQERGSVVHKALELLWRDLQSQARLKALAPDELASLIRSGAESALGLFAARREGSRALDQFRKLEQARLEDLLRRWLDVETHRPHFEVIQSEKARTVPIAGLNLDIRVDRIDQYDDGTHAIIDYKTSKDVSIGMWDGERPEAPQLPLYATTSGLQISEVAFAQVATASVEWKGLQGGALREPLLAWDAVVRKLAGDFLHGRAEVDPRQKPDACEFCKLSALCRVTELRKLPTAGEDGDE